MKLTEGHEDGCVRSSEETLLFLNTGFRSVSAAWFGLSFRLWAGVRTPCSVLKNLSNFKGVSEAQETLIIRGVTRFGIRVTFLKVNN